MKHTTGVVGLSVFLASAVSVGVASEPPDSAINPVSGNIETAYGVWSGSHNDIDYLIASETTRVVYTVSDHTSNDLRPRIAIGSGGDAWVTWWRDGTTDRILVRKRHYSNGTWGGERVVSEAGEDSANPAIVHDGTDSWVAYEYAGANQTAIAVSLIIDEPEPLGVRTTVAATDYTGTVDVTISSDSGHLWATWVDSSSDVGWSEYDYITESWESTSYESYAEDSINDARERIRADVVGQ